jgi:hypothetical protein
LTLIRHAFADSAATAPVIRVRTSVTVAMIAARLRQRKRIVLTVLMKTVTARLTVMTQTVTNAVEENAGSRSM